MRNVSRIRNVLFCRCGRREAYGGAERKSTQMKGRRGGKSPFAACVTLMFGELRTFQDNRSLDAVAYGQWIFYFDVTSIFCIHALAFWLLHFCRRRMILGLGKALRRVEWNGCERQAERKLDLALANINLSNWSTLSGVLFYIFYFSYSTVSSSCSFQSQQNQTHRYNLIEIEKITWWSLKSQHRLVYLVFSLCLAEFVWEWDFFLVISYWAQRVEFSF